VAKPFNYDLGGFDPVFPGITLHFPNEAIWNYTQAAAELIFSYAAQDMLSQNPNLERANIAPALVSEWLLQNPDRGFTLSADEKERLGQSLIAAVPNDAVGYLTASSAHEHERRHFHDWLLSPYTAAINAIRLEVFLNYARLRPFIYGGGTTVVPVPLTRWLRKTPPEQAELTQMWQALLSESGVKLRLPDFSPPGVLAAIENIERRYGSISGLFQPLNQLPGFNAAAVFEASAILIQTQAIHDIWGETASTRFIMEMANPENHTPYTYVLAPMTQWQKPGEVLENDILLGLVTWSLLGNNDVDTKNANPLVRLLHVFRYLGKHGFPQLGTPSQAIFASLEQECGAVGYHELLTQSVQLSDTILGNLMADVQPNASNFELGVLQAYEVLHDCHKHMVSHFLKDPDGYANPVDYLDRTLGIWPEPPVCWSFGRPFRRVKREALSNYKGVVLFDEPCDQDDVFLRRGITGRHEVTPIKVDLQIADNWQYACALTDTLFAEFNRDQPEIELQRDQWKKRGVYLMEVLT
jgi:hypothetical protein